LEEHVRALPDGAATIDGYAAGSFTVSGIRYAGSILILPSGTVVAWAITSPAAVDEASLAPVRGAAGEIELLVIGTGARSWLVPPPIREAVRRWGVVIEAMPTAAACRTYNILLADRRKVAAALIALPTQPPGYAA
jgi:uncharacterized protein